MAERAGQTLAHLVQQNIKNGCDATEENDAMDDDEEVCCVFHNPVRDPGGSDAISNNGPVYEALETTILLSCRRKYSSIFTHL